MRKFYRYNGVGERMGVVRGGMFRRLALSLLVILVEFVYKAPLHAMYLLYNDTLTTNALCGLECRRLTEQTVVSNYGPFATGVTATTMAGYVAGNVTSGVCYCLTTSEFNFIQSCIARSCTEVAVGGYGTIKWAPPGVFIANRPVSSSLGSCSFNSCYCGAGTYLSTTTTPKTCKACSVGYYCPGGSYWLTSTTTTGRVVCAPGYYCSTTRLATQTLCEAGRYSSTIAQSTCQTCLAGYYCPGGTSVICPAGKYCSAPSLSAATACGAGYYCSTTGLKAPTSCYLRPPATTATTTATAITSCYVPANTGLTSDRGVYIFTSDCYYAN